MSIGKPGLFQYAVGNREMVIPHHGSGKWLSKDEILEWLEYIQDNDGETLQRVKELYEALT